MPATVKTAISLRRELFRKSDRLARRMRISRSRLVTMALDEFLRRHENDELLARLNAAYADYPDRSEREWLGSARRQAARVARGEG